MTYSQGNFKENNSALARIGVVQEARYVPDVEQNMTPLETLVEGQSIKPAELVIKGLTRVYAVVLVRELDKHLNPLTFLDEDIVAPLAYMDEATLASIEREPLHIRTDIDADYDVLLQESAP